MLRLALAVVLLAGLPAIALAQPESASGLSRPRPGARVPSPADGLPPAPATSVVPAPPTAARVGLEGEVAIPSSVARRLRVLQSSLDGLALRGGSNVGDGITSLVSAGIGFGFGALARSNGDTSTARYLFVFGGVGIAQAGLAFARPRATGYASRMSIMPMSTEAEVLARLEFGETSLQHLARVHRALRFTDGSLSIAASLGTLPLLLGSDGFDSSDHWDWIVVVSAGLSATMGLVTLIQRSDAERRWRTYVELTEEIERTEQRGLTLRGVTPYASPYGVGGAAEFAF